jgi:hypothetical protein
LILLAPLAARRDCLYLTRRLHNSLLHHVSEHFDGTISQWRAIFDRHHDALVAVRAENPEFFNDGNWAIFSVFNMTVPNEPGEVTAPTQADMIHFFETLRTLESGTSLLSNRIKALWLALDALRRRGSVPHDVAVVFTGKPRYSGMVQCRWLAMQQFRNEVSLGFHIALLDIGAELLPCVASPYVPPKRAPWPMKGLTEIAERLDALYDDFFARATVPVVGDQHDVIVGTLSRIRYLGQRILDAAKKDDGLLQEILLRSLADSAIQLLWLILRNDDELYTKFKSHSFAAERDALADIQEQLRKAGFSDDEIRAQAGAQYADLMKRAGILPEVFDRIYGPWSELSTAAMAREIGDTLLLSVFQRASDATHGSWRSLEKYQLSRCENPLHVPHHRLAEEESRSCGIVSILAALLFMLSTLLAAIDAFIPELKDAAVALDIDLRSWMRNNQSSFGVFNWEDVVE